MARSKSPPNEGGISARTETRSDSTPGPGDDTSKRTISSLVYQGLDKVEVTERQAELQEGPDPDPEISQTDTQEPDTQEPDTQEPDTQEPDTQEPDTQEPDTQEPDTQEPVTQEPSTQEPNTQGTEEWEPAAQAVGSKKSQQPAEGALSTALPKKTKKRVRKSLQEELSSRRKRIREAATSRRNAGQEHSQENDSALGVERIPEQIRFFDVQFDNMSKEYKIVRLQHDVCDWDDLKPESTFTSQDETFRRGELVHIKLYDSVNVSPGDDVARVEDIRVLSSADQRKLVLISWVYCADGGLYDSNHLQIVLWDTITRRTAQPLAQQVRTRQLYNVCGGKKFCSEKIAEIWRERKAHLLKRTGG